MVAAVAPEELTAMTEDWDRKLFGAFATRSPRAD